MEFDDIAEVGNKFYSLKLLLKTKKKGHVFVDTTKALITLIGQKCLKS